MSTTMTTTITRRDSVTDIAPVEPVKITKNSIAAMLALVKVMKKFENHYSTGRKELTIELDRCDFNTNLEEFGASVNALMNMLARHTPSRTMFATPKARVERHWVPMPNIEPHNDLNSASMQCDDIMISVNDQLYAFTIAAASLVNNRSAD